MKVFLITAFLALATTCSKTQLLTFENAGGTIKVFVCTRGCYQYLLEHEGQFYFPGQLPEELKKDGLPVTFSGILQPDFTMVKKPAPNDIPIDDFEARNIKITHIEER